METSFLLPCLSCPCLICPAVAVAAIVMPAIVLVIAMSVLYIRVVAHTAVFVVVATPSSSGSLLRSSPGYRSLTVLLQYNFALQPAIPFALLVA
jgi:hypothetical protein